MASVNVDKLVEGLRAHFATDEIVSLIDEIQKDGVLDKVSAGFALVKECIPIVEQLAIDLDDLDEVQGKDKRDALVKFLDDCIELPFWAEPFDDNIIGTAIDGLVWWYNHKIGHDWLAKVKDLLL